MFPRRLSRYGVCVRNLARDKGEASISSSLRSGSSMSTWLRSGSSKFTSLRSGSSMSSSLRGGTCRGYSTVDSVFQHIQLSTDEGQGVAVLRMNNKPVNGLNLLMMTEIVEAVDSMEKNKECRALIITSAIPKIFTGGLDLSQVYEQPREHSVELWRAVQQLYLRLYHSKLVTIAAINGTSPAGGCMIAMTCDHRVMADGKYGIGLNEAQLGLVAPYWLRDTMVNTIGQRESERALQLGRMYRPAEALAVGLVDEVVDEADVMSRANEAAQKWLQVPDEARQITKFAMREKTYRSLLEHLDEDVQWFVEDITQERTQKALGAYLKALKRKGT